MAIQENITQNQPPIDDKAVALLYEDLKDSYDVGSLEDFKVYLSDKSKRDLFFEQVIKPEYDVETIDDFESAYGFTEKKNQVDTPSSGQKEVTESITETPTEPGSLDSSQENVEQPVEIIEQPVEVVEQNIVPGVPTIELTETDGVLTESIYTSSLLNDLTEKRNQAVEAERKREEQLSKTPSLYRSMQGSEAKDEDSLLEIDEVLREKILNDFNVKKALEFGFIHENLITNALKGDLEAISSLSDLATKSPEEYRQQIKDKKLNSKYGYANDSDISIEYSPEDRESGILNDRKKEAEDKVKSWNTETRKLLDAIPGGEGEATEEQLNNVFNREGAPTEEEFDLAEEEYVPTGFEKSDIHEMYDTQKLQELGKDGEKFDVKEFDGYLKEQGYFQAYKNMIEEETVDETGESYSMYSSYNPTLAAERLKAQYLTNFINDRVEKRTELQIVNYQLENEGRHPVLDGVELDISTGLDDKAVTQYIEKQFPMLTAKLKEQDVKNQENYQRYLDGENPVFTQSVKQGWRSIEDRINTFSEGTYEGFGANNIADQVRMQQAENELSRDDFMRYAYASGKKAYFDGREYGIDERGQIYDLDIKKNVTNVLTDAMSQEIRKEVGKSSETFKSTSGAGIAIATTGIVSDMMLQIALTRGVGMFGQGVKGGAVLFQRGKNVVKVLEKIPMKATTASAMIAQGTLFSTNLASSTYKNAIENGIDEATARELQTLAAQQGFALGSITAPISTQAVAMNKIFGGSTNKISQAVVSTYQNGGKKGLIEYFKRLQQTVTSNYPVYLRESGKEVFQENVQQGGQAFVIGNNVNEIAKKEIMANTITGAEYTNTTILAGLAGLLMPFGGDLSATTKTSLKANFNPGAAAIDRLEALHKLSENVDKTEQFLNSMVTNGAYTEEQVKNLLGDIDVYVNTINSIPTNLTPETSLAVMRYVNEIKKQEALKKKRDKAFHPAIDEKINELRNEITVRTQFDYVNSKGKLKLKEEAGRELNQEAIDSGETDITITDGAITQRAIDNFNQMDVDTKLKYTDLNKSDLKTKTDEDAISKPSTEEQVLPDAPTSTEGGKDSEVELQQVGEGDVEQVTTDTKIEEGETQTDKPSDTTTKTDTEQLTQPTSTEGDMSVNNQIESFANRIVEGGNQESFSEDAIQFYAENKEAIDNAVSQKKKQQPKTQSKERALALKIARGDTEFSNAEIDLYTKSEGAVKAEVDAIGKTNSQTVTANTYKSIIASTKIKGKPKTIKVKSDYSAMKKDLQKEARVARNAKNDVNKRRKGLQGAIDLVLKAGNITTKKANSLLKKVSNVNLYNAKKVQDVIDFTTRAMNDAEYSNKLDKAKKLQKSIKNKLKGKEAGLSDAAKKFTQVNPSNVNDIDTYLEKASEISNGLTPTRKPSKGELKVSKPFDIKKIEEYSKKETELEAERNYELAKESFQELTGLEPGDLTLDQMKEILYEVDGSTNTSETDAQTLKDKKNAIDKAANNAFKNTKINIKGAIESGDIKVTKTQKTLINNFLNMDLSLMTTKQKLEALDSIVNFELNQSTGGMEASLMQQVGNTKITRLKNKGVKNTENKSLFGLGKFWNKQISTLPNVFELTFKSQQKARMVMDALGLDGIINGSAKAQKEAANTEKDYADKFAKKKMQDGIYFDESNDTERGILADVRRFTPGTESEQQKEFEKSKKLIEQTYERLMASGDKLKVKKGEIVKAQYDKLLKDSNSIADVESKADPANLDGVKYVTEIWAKKYNELADTSLNVYNKNLGKDTNYTPRNIQKVKQPKAEDVDITQPVFNPEGNKRKSAYDKKTGVLKEATKPGSLDTGDVLNLSFDAQNMSNYKAALTDIYTAPSIQQVKGARESKAFNEVFTNESAKEIINERINSYVDSKRGKKYVDGSTKRALNRLNKVATLGVSRVLGGPTQFVKQIVPIFNTMFNAGLSNTLKGSKLIFDAEVQKAIDNSGLPIANRGIQSQSDIENADSRIKKKAQTKGGRVIDAADKINKKTLEAFLVYPDVQTARASFIAYYIQQVKKDGGDTTNIDWSKPLDKKAAQYAQQQVDRQQNTSDQDLQGDLFTDQGMTSQVLRKTLFPFANFLLNQKTRMYSDINTLTNNPTALPGDKTRALKSLGGLGVETVMFNAIGLGITQTLAAAARLISGEEEDPNLNRYANKRAREEKREKEFNQRLIGRTGNALADVLVPIPILNDESLNQINGLMSMFQDDEDNPFQFFAKTDKKIIDQLGTLGIGAKKVVILADMIKTIVTGEKTTVFMGRESKAQIDPEKLNALKMTTMAYAMHLIGVPVLNSSEVGYIAERAFKDIGKSREIEEKVDYIVEAEAVLNQRGIKNPSQKMIDNEAKQLKRIDQGKDRKVEKTNSKSKDDKSFSPASFGNEKGKKKSGKSFNPKSF